MRIERVEGEAGKGKLMVYGLLVVMQQPTYSFDVQVETGIEHVQAGLVGDENEEDYLQLLNSKTNTMKQIVLTK
jgi:hypothetical protein